MPQHHQPIEVYTNPHGDIVIRQPQESSGDACTVVVERADVATLIERLIAESQRALD